VAVEAQDKRFPVPGCHQFLPCCFSVGDIFQFSNVVDLKRPVGRLVRLDASLDVIPRFPPTVTSDAERDWGQALDTCLKAFASLTSCDLVSHQ
jgi:hypothetical protein